MVEFPFMITLESSERAEREAEQFEAMYPNWYLSVGFLDYRSKFPVQMAISVIETETSELVAQFALSDFDIMSPNLKELYDRLYATKV